MTIADAIQASSEYSPEIIKSISVEVVKLYYVFI